MDDELSPREVAERLGVTTRTVQRWIVGGTLPARRVGGRWRVANVAVVAFERRTERGPTSDAAQDVPGPEIAPQRHPPISRLFVANRGEIATRIRRTGDRLGITTIVPPTTGPHVLDLLDIEAVVAAARSAAADAIHPGFGFLAENADFAEAVERAGIRWIGPPPTAIRAMGDKAAARQLAARLGVPVVPGYDGRDQTDDRLVAEARRIGMPILVKPAAGGGGKGMRTVGDLERLPDALASARREAIAAFGDDRIVLERLIEGPRHVEIQVLFDAHGHGIHLGERDCSIQRRHQKVLEETPSPGVDAPLRARLGGDAVRLAAAVGYVSAGTVEFLVDDRGRHHFLEMNTRLQVEHPVTELVTGLDLVAEQLAIAEGRPAGLDQAAADARRTGHAVEVRLYAEDAEAGFLPATGTIRRLVWPVGDGIRVDAGVAEGDTVTDRFDPMLAKIVAHGDDREQALGRLARALDATTVLGVVTNLRFLRWLVRHPVVRDGQARIDTLDRIWPPDDWVERTAIPDETWAHAGRLLLGFHGPDDPWSGGWRLNAPPVVRLEADDGTSRRFVFPMGGWQAFEERTALDPATGTVHADVEGRSVAITLAPAPDANRAARAAAAHAGTGGPIDLVAPMPGAVLAVHGAPGDRVEAGDPVVTLEAMKMEHVVAAPRNGTLGEVAVRSGDQVTRGQRLASVE
jgi:excisionase family DNA binding protein